MNEEDGYSQVADEQLDALAEGPDAGLYDAVLEACDLIFRIPSRAQSVSTSITTEQGTRLRLAVPGHHPYKVFWSSDGPRVEAVFPHP